MGSKSRDGEPSFLSKARNWREREVSMIVNRHTPDYKIIISQYIRQNLDDSSLLSSLAPHFVVWSDLSEESLEITWKMGAVTVL